MLGVTPQYRGTMRNYVIAFGSLFDDIDIQRKNSMGEVIKTIRVPISYGPSQKYISRINFDAKSSSLILPRLSFEISGITYDSSRKLSKLGGYVGTTEDGDKKTFVYNPVPWDINMTLSLLVKNAEDGTQILEQILPFFVPSFIVPIKEVEELGIVRDTPIVLNSVSVSDDYEGDYSTRRVLEWSLDFTIKGYLYGSSKESPIIRSAETNLADLNTNNKYRKTTVTPDPEDASPNNDYGFNSSVEDF